MTKTILIVDDEARIRRMITGYLRDSGAYVLLEAGDGHEALRHMARRTVDLVILDLMMPHLDGEGFIKAVRRKSDVYIIILTAKTGEDEQVYHYSLGADDYIEKPFSCKALTLKVAAVLSRMEQKQPPGMPMRQVKGMMLNESTRELTIEGEKRDLKPKEYDLLLYLQSNQNIALSRERILDEVWGLDYEGSDRTVDIHISNVRKKLGKYQSCIKTVPSYGYKFEVRE